MFFLAGDLPSDRETRDRILLRVIGSPDPLDQIEIAHAALETRRQLGKSIQLIA